MDLRDDGPVGIIAGAHNLPFEVIEALRQQGRDYFVFGLVGEADQRIEAHPHTWLKWGEVGRILKILAERQIRHVLFIGAVTNRPDFASIKLDLGAIKVMPEIVSILARGGDEGVLAGVASFAERRGFLLVSVPQIAPSLVIGDKTSINVSLADRNSRDIGLAAEAANLVGALDAGQGAVVANGRILALEGPEGTDQMLARVTEIRKQGRAKWSFGKQGLLLKRARPGQDMRFDMPTIGPNTIDHVHAAGLAGIVCAQGEVLCASMKDTLERANHKGVFVVAKDLSDHVMIDHMVVRSDADLGAELEENSSNRQQLQDRPET